MASPRSDCLVVSDIISGITCRRGCKAEYKFVKIMNASGPGQSPGRGSGGRYPPEAEAFLSQSMPKTQSPGTLALNHVYLLYTYSNNN